MKIQISKVSKKLKKLREEKKFTQEELAHSIGVSRQSIISLEQGRCLPSLPLALNFAEFFNTTLDDIFDFELERKELKIPYHNIVDTSRREVNKMSRDLTPWSPMREVSSLHEAIDRLFEDSWPIPEKTALSLPHINVYEKDGSVIVEADLPGVKEEDISIEVGEDSLLIRGERKSEQEIKDKNYYRKESSYGSFSRAISFPAVIDKEKAEAELKDGILTVVLPKKEEALPKVTKIKVKKA